MPDVCGWLAANGTSCAELLGFVSGALSVYLVTRESIWNWPLGIITAGFYIVVFAESGLYSDTGLQAVYLVLSLYGWWHWLYGGSRETGVVVATTPRSTWWVLAASGTALWLVLYTITSRLPGAKLPLFDAALTSTSLVAQYMMTRKYVENWLLWITVDVVYVGLFVARGLRLTALLYAVYLALAVLGYVQWKRSMTARSLALS